ncbi:MAG: transposase, partial [Chloroflexota bacterium]
ATLLNTLQEFTNAFNFVCEYGWQNSEKNGVKLHHATYYTVKEMCKGLVSDLIVQARTKATEAVKSAFSRVKAGRKASQPHSRLCPARYNVHTYKLDWNKRQVNLATSPGNRLIMGFTVPEYASKYTGFPVDTADLIYRKGKFWLHVVVTVPEPDYLDNQAVVGVDLGLNRPAVTSGRKFLGKKHWKEVDRRNFRLKKALQSKGTKSAKRHLKKLSGKVQRFRKDCDRVLSKRIVQSCTSGTTIVIENLTEIRSRARLRKGEGQRRLHSWSFAQLRSFLDYKAQEAGMRVVAIDPRHTSQTCSKCSFQYRHNRKSQSLFLCRSCGYTLNADLNASYNIRDKHLASFGKSLAGGPQSTGL